MLLGNMANVEINDVDDLRTGERPGDCSPSHGEVKSKDATARMPGP